YVACGRAPHGSQTVFRHLFRYATDHASDGQSPARAEIQTHRIRRRAEGNLQVVFKASRISEAGLWFRRRAAGQCASIDACESIVTRSPALQLVALETPRTAWPRFP